MFLKNAWYGAGWSDDLGPGQMKQHFIIGQPVVLARLADGTLVALEDRCAHRAAALSYGQIEGDSLRCMYHGVRFDARTGVGLEVPGQARPSDGMRVRTYPVHVRQGWIFVWMGNPAKADLVLVPPVAGPHNREWALCHGEMDYDANYVLINDNLCDLSHLSFVHVESFGLGDASRLSAWAAERPDVTVLDRGIHVQRWVEGAPVPPFIAEKVSSGRIDRLAVYDYLAPGVFLMFAEIYPEGTCRATGGQRPTDIEPLYADFASQTVVPMTDRSTRYYFTWGARTRDTEPGMPERMRAMTIAAFKEDKRMVEMQQRIHDATPDLVFQPTVHDRGANQMRLVMKRLMEAEQAA